MTGALYTPACTAIRVLHTLVSTCCICYAHIIYSLYVYTYIRNSSMSCAAIDGVSIVVAATGV
jgi:hypothetical protein